MITCCPKVRLSDEHASLDWTYGVSLYMSSPFYLPRSWLVAMEIPFVNPLPPVTLEEVQKRMIEIFPFLETAEGHEG